MAHDFTQQNIYTTIDKKIRKACTDNNRMVLANMKIIDIGKYVDKRFKQLHIETKSFNEDDDKDRQKEQQQNTPQLKSAKQSNHQEESDNDETNKNNNNNTNNLSGIKKQLPIINENTKAYIFNNNHNQNDDRSGFIIIPKCLSPEQQIFWSYHILNDLSQPSICKSNIKPSSQFEKNTYRKFVQECSTTYKTSGTDLNNNKRKNKYHKKMEALKWSTFGHHFDFDNEMYHGNIYNNEENGDDDNDDDKAGYDYDLDDWYNELPSTFGILASHIIYSLGIISNDGLPFQPDTSFVNYYINRDRKAGHRNLAEQDQHAPVVGISLLNDGIFLLGGETKDVLPIPMLLHSGDIIIMNGKSRRVTHGISCIIKNTIQKDILHGLVDHTLANITLPIQDNDDDPDTKKKFTSMALKNYLNILRLGINIRQVFKRRDELQHKFYFLKNHEITYY